MKVWLWWKVAATFNQMDATYKTELRQLNELNFARFEAKLEQQPDRLRSDMKAGFANVRAEQVRWMFLVWATLMATVVGLR